ncbi:putative LPLAT superfamily acyltransferase [Kushneria sinocarnis]|uniref:Putative LPLAT superfamily acyltransferase n=1 Tax=Kushneria sinocarnis TaxID=595502 RepID=A0A420WX59_9GAMM|nr:glycosyl transferase [Kushneria sinocarnis]RKR04341.1 putative LPLAT superfamily acyltransferase [Kushneria sinocarnis]
MTAPHGQDTHWSRVEESGTVTGMRLMLAIDRWLGEWAFRLLLIPAAAYFWLRRPLARRASREYRHRLQHTFPQLRLGPLATLRHFICFGMTMLDKVRALHGRIDGERVHLPDRATLREAIESGRGGLILVSHLGNHEICQALSRQRPDLRLSLLMHTRHAQRFNALLASADRGERVEVIEVSEITPETAQRLRERIDEGGFVVIAADREPISGDQRARSFDFLGAPAPFPEGAFRLALLLRCPLYLLLCARNGRGYSVHFEALGDSRGVARAARETWLATHMAAFVRRLETYCGRYPLQWFNFYPFWKSPAHGSDRGQR